MESGLPSLGHPVLIGTIDTQVFTVKGNCRDASLCRSIRDGHLVHVVDPCHELLKVVGGSVLKPDATGFGCVFAHVLYNSTSIGLSVLCAPQAFLPIPRAVVVGLVKDPKVGSLLRNRVFVAGIVVLNATRQLWLIGPSVLWVNIGKHANHHRGIHPLPVKLLQVRV